MKSEPIHASSHATTNPTHQAPIQSGLAWSRERGSVRVSKSVNILRNWPPRRKPKAGPRTKKVWNDNETKN